MYHIIANIKMYITCRRLFANIVFLVFLTNLHAQNNAILIEAEDADTIGNDFDILTEGEVTYLTPLTDLASLTNPGTSDKVLTFKISFTAPGTYELYVKLRVGPEAWSDDSFYFGNGFGIKPVSIDSSWIRVNNIGNGAANPDEYVLSPEENSAGNEIFKWINASETGEGVVGGTLFVVEEDSLTQIFQIGSRENGLDVDKIAFGNSDLFYTVSNPENGEAGVSEVPEPDFTVYVELDSTIGPVTHCASGALYGITETLPVDIEKLVAPLNPNMYIQPARSGPGFQQPIGAALPVSERLVSTTAEVTIRLADINPYWPYQWVGWESWENEVTAVINEKLASGRDNYYGYEIWNEQHGTWNEEANGGDFFNTLWKPTYDLIRNLDPEAKIIGPSDSYYLRSRMEDFLTFCLDSSCLPDIICWHELGGSENISSNIASYRSLETSLGISHREISINEYSSSTHEYEGCPGVLAPFIAKFERNRVYSAAISWWFTGLPGRLGSLLTASNAKGGGWWFYKWYGEMTGDMVSLTPPREHSDGIDGFACLDEDEKYASICLGGSDTGLYDLSIRGIPLIFGDSVYVKVEYIPWENKDTPVSGPVTVSITRHTTLKDTIVVPLNISSPFYGYHIYISPEYDSVITVDLKITEPISSGIKIYPNPANMYIFVDLPEILQKAVNLKIYNIAGVLVKYQEISKQNNMIDVSDLETGLYIMYMNIDNNLERFKFIKQ
jgi:hypothetical protein